jgi:hypothetical protein
MGYRVKIAARAERDLAELYEHIRLDESKAPDRSARSAAPPEIHYFPRIL